MKHNFKNLEIWKRSRILVQNIYFLTNNFPEHEKYILTQQIRRASISIPSNIAEGSGRKGNKEFIQFLYISIGSICELETQLYLASDLNYPKKSIDHIFKEIESLRKMIYGFIQNLLKNEN